MFKNVDDAFNWMVSFTNLEKKPDLSKRGYRLDKMEFLLEIFKNPHMSYKIIHVAGSKGKGSTCGFLASILNEAGYKTGVYSSPHLIDFRERITNNHNFFSKNSYLSVINKIKNKLSDMNFEDFPGGEPTTFELMTLAAFMIFKKEKCQLVVLETGLGGRLDSTNVVTPIASVITPIELEHTDLLGETIEEITGEKAGIIKKGVPVFTSNFEKKVLEIIRSRADSLQSPFYNISEKYSSFVNENGSFLIYKSNEYKLGLEGRIQGENALLAIKVINKIFPNITTEIIVEGLMKTTIPGRFQKLQAKVPVIVDGAHTKNSIKNTVDTFTSLYKSGTLIFGALEGKDITSMVLAIKGYFSKIIISKPGTFKNSNLPDLQEVFITEGIQTEIIEDPRGALREAESYNSPILVTGSFYMAGEIAKILGLDEQ